MPGHGFPYDDDELGGDAEFERDREAEENAAREEAYDRLCEMGPGGMGDLDLRAAAQHAQVVGDAAAERRADDVLASRRSV